MNQSFFKEFFAGFIRTRAISRHFRRLAILDAIQGTTVTRDILSVLNHTLQGASDSEMDQLLVNLDSHLDGLSGTQDKLICARVGTNEIEQGKPRRKAAWSRSLRHQALLEVFMRKIYQCIQVCACAIAALCIFSSIAQADGRTAMFAVSNTQIQALGITTAPLQSQSGSVRASFPAQVVVPPNAEQVISSPVAGLVSQLLVQQNQMVRSGAPLIRIASPEFGQLQLQLLQANSRATLARQAAQREQQLFDEGIIPLRRMQEAQAGLKEAEAVLSQAKAALRLTGMPSETIDGIAASGNPQESLTLVSTQAGVVTEIAVKIGQRVDSSSSLLHVVQTDTLGLDIQVPVAESASWRSGSRVKVQGRDIAAHILSISPSVSTSSQTVVLRAVIEGKAGQVRPGEFLTVELPVAAAAGGWDLPLSAVAHDGNQAYVFVRTADGFEARPVKVASSAGQRVRVQGPLKAGEQVAVSSVVALKGAWLAGKESK